MHDKGPTIARHPLSCRTRKYVSNFVGLDAEYPHVIKTLSMRIRVVPMHFRENVCLLTNGMKYKYVLFRTYNLYIT